MVHARELVGGDDVDHERRDQHCPHRPEHDGARQRGLAERAQPLRVPVDLLLAEEHLERPDHVGEDVAEQDDPAHRHEPLLADRRLPEPHEEVTLGAGQGDRGAGVAGERSRGVGVRPLVGGRDLFFYRRHESEPTVRPRGKWDCESVHEQSGRRRPSTSPSVPSRSTSDGGRRREGNFVIELTVPRGTPRGHAVAPILAG